MLRGTTAAIVLAVFLGVVPTSLQARSRELMTLRRVLGSYPTVDRAPQHGGVVFTNYDDSEAWQGEWTVELWYRNCPTTRARTIRLIEYRIPGSQNVPLFPPRLARRAIPYAYTGLDRKTSDAPMWKFDAAPKGTSYHKVDALGRRPCGYWGVAATGN